MIKKNASPSRLVSIELRTSAGTTIRFFSSIVSSCSPNRIACSTGFGSTGHRRRGNIYHVDPPVQVRNRPACIFCKERPRSVRAPGENCAGTAQRARLSTIRRPFHTPFVDNLSLQHELRRAQTQGVCERL